MQHFDVIIIGSGPTGSAYARTILDSAPTTRVLMVESGPIVTNPPGYHFSNITDDLERTSAQLGSQGPNRGKAYPPMSEDERAARLRGEPDVTMLRRPGLFVVDSEFQGKTFPAGHAASNVGGMGAQWFGACPAPSADERIGIIAPAELDRLLDKSRRLLRVSNTQFPDSPIAKPLESILNGLFSAGRSDDRKAQPMPMALVREGARIQRTGTDVILGTLGTAAPENFELRPETTCLQILMENGRATGVELVGEDRKPYRVTGDYVVAAADSLHTPQLLFASGIRPASLGHYLNEHPQVSALAIFDRLGHVGAGASTPDRAGGILADRSVTSLMTSGVTWLPYNGEQFPFHVQITQADPESLSPEDRAEAGDKPVLSISFFLASDIIFNNAIHFSESAKDWLGRPKMTIQYDFTARDLERIELAKMTWQQIAQAVGRPLPGHAPRMPPNGSSLHYQGTMRMGAANDGGSVCDTHCRVWDTDNLYIAGNGLIPTETAGNPTMISVALAIRGAESIVDQIAAAHTAQSRAAAR
ncbi:GMC oxidoreductase [Devosia sp. 2618]|uniref:GMC oxidoreductase n=1 Tax=Devosia sp. 2618 TaxID=3156454 RepID=UPI0033989ACA